MKVISNYAKKMFENASANLKNALEIKELP